MYNKQMEIFGNKKGTKLAKGKLADQGLKNQFASWAIDYVSAGTNIDPGVNSSNSFSSQLNSIYDHWFHRVVELPLRGLIRGQNLSTMNMPIQLAAFYPLQVNHIILSD